MKLYLLGMGVVFSLQSEVLGAAWTIESVEIHINNNYVKMDWLYRGMELPSIRIKALAKSFSHQLWPLLAALARAIIEASAFCSGFNSDVRQFN